MTKNERVDLGLVDSIDAESIGPPGKRTFNITASSPRGGAVVWMEKEQLFQIGVAIRQFSLLGDAPASPERFEPEYAAPETPAVVEFKASDLRLRHDGRTDTFTLEAVSPDDDAENGAEEPTVTVQFSFSRAAGEKLARKSLEIVAAGRPRCPLCGGPIDPEGHICPRSNGHHREGFTLA